MKILFFTDHFWPEPSAPAAHVYERAKLWAKAGHEVTVICSAPNFPEGKVYEGYRNRLRHVEILEGVRVLRVMTYIAANEGFFLRTLDYISYALSALVNSLFEEKPDVVVSTSPHLFVPLSGVTYSWIKGVPHVFEIRDLWPASILSTGAMRRGWAYRLLEKLELSLYRASSRIISLTHSFVEDITSRGVPKEKVDVVINGANISLFSPRPRDLEIEEMYGLRGRFVVGYLGTVGMASGLHNVIEAAKRLVDTNVTFFIVGVGAIKASLEEAAAKAGLTNVVFVPRQVRDDMPRYWSVVDVSLIHLKNDPVFKTVIPSKIFESMAMGRPILFTVPVGEGSRIVEKHEAGLVVEPNNPSALAEAVLKLRKNPEMMQRLSRNSLTAASEYSRETQANKTMDALLAAVQAAR